jgi:hypothetical protein
MRRNFGALLIGAVVLVCFWALFSFIQPDVRANANSTAVSIVAVSQAPQQCALASAPNSSLPGDVTVPFQNRFIDQCAVDQFAWQSFIALNWPAAAFDPNSFNAITRGLPDTTQTIGGSASGDAQTVWEVYQQNSYVFALNSNGTLNPPAAGIQGWQTAASPPGACGGTKQNVRVLTAITKAVGQPAGLEQAFSGPLIDQHGYYARYEVLLNWDSLNYIVSNHLYDSTPQNIAVNFPAGSATQTGTIMLKAAWKILSAAEASSGRFHTSQAFLYNPPINNAGGTIHIPASCTGPVTMGLVGLHIAHKTASFPQWIWATFEQIDNAPDRAGSPPKSWSFSSQNCPGCALNQQPACPHNLGSGNSQICDWQPTMQHVNASLAAPTQVVRDTSISSDPPGPLINTDAQQKLRNVNPKSVWQFYQLVDAQWPLTPCGSVAACTSGQTPIQCKLGVVSCAAAQPIPPLLSNTTMETYFQSLNPNPQLAAEGTCLGCHGALSSTVQGKFADFTFELENASKPPTTPRFRLTTKSRR